jgi:hypothetical protein
MKNFYLGGDDNMKIELRRNRSMAPSDKSLSLDRRLASYLAASASIGAVMATDAKAIVISNHDVKSFGINGVVNIDYNSDGQTDFQIDHDRVDLTPQGGPVVDYLQIDKNDINGENNPLAFDPLTGFQAATFAPNGTIPNDQNNAAYLIQNPGNANNIEYPSALLAGAQIGPTSNFDYQEGENVYGGPNPPHKTGRMGRLIDEDHGQVDMLLGGKTSDQIVTPANTPQFVGVANQVRYLGVRMDLNNASAGNTASEYNFGWIGVKITNEADATGQVVGYGYDTQAGTSILAGDSGGRAGDYNNDGKVDAADYVAWRKGSQLQNETVSPGSNTAADYTPWQLNYGATAAGSGASFGSGTAVPEPGSVLLGLASGLGLICIYICRRIRGK